MGYFNETNIANMRATLALGRNHPSLYDAYNMTSTISEQYWRSMENWVLQYDAWKERDAYRWADMMRRAMGGYSQVLGSSGDFYTEGPFVPATLERVIYGYYGQYKDQVLAALNEIAKAAGVSVSWQKYQLRAMKFEYDDQVVNGREPMRIFSHSQPFSDLIYLPIKLAGDDLNNAGLKAAAANLAPGTAWYHENAGLGNMIDSARDKARFNKFILTVAIIATAGYASAAYAAAGASGAAAGTGASSAAAGAGTASVSGAELAALVEAGTVGTAGVTLETAAIAGQAVTYSTATGALGAIVPLTGGGAVSSSLAPSAEVTASVAEEAAALGVAETSPGVFQAAAPAAAETGAAATGLEGAVKGIFDAGAAVVKGVATTLFGQGVAKLANEIAGEDEQPAQQVEQAAPQGVNPLALGGLFLVGLVLARVA